MKTFGERENWLSVNWQNVPVGLLFMLKCVIFCIYTYVDQGASLRAKMLKNPPTMRETWVPSLGQEDPLEKGMSTYSSVLACRIPWTEESGGLGCIVHVVT